MTARLFIALGLLFCCPLYAAEAHPLIQHCDTRYPEHQQRVALSRCLDEQMVKIDRLLATWVNQQKYKLEELRATTGRESALNMFLRSQKQFEQFRESNCRWYFLVKSPALTASDEYKRCYIRTSQMRIDELQSLP